MTAVTNYGTWQDHTITWSFAEYNYLISPNDPDYPNYPDVGTYSSFINNSGYQAVIRAAFAKWEAVADITFTEVKDTSNYGTRDGASDGGSTAADIRIGFHDFNWLNEGIIGQTFLKYTEQQNSDGVHTYFKHDTQIELEDPSEWKLTGNNYTYENSDATLYQVALHEIGHSLGLIHNATDQYSIMYAYAIGSNQDLDFTDVSWIQSLYGAKSDAKYYVQDLTTGDTAYLKGETYSGPLDGLLKDELIIGSTTTENTIEITSDMLNITSTGPSAFIHTGSNKDAIDVSASTGSLNVMDGGGESNFLKGSTTGRNVAYVDDRSSTPTDIWSTLANAHGGDDFIIWGITDADFKTYGQWADNQGAGGYTGLTFHMSKDGGVHYASATLSGYSTADLQSGKVSYSFGTTSDGNNYMDIKIGTTVQS